MHFMQKKVVTFPLHNSSEIMNNKNKEKKSYFFTIFTLLMISFCAEISAFRFCSGCGLFAASNFDKGDVITYAPGDDSPDAEITENTEVIEVSFFCLTDSLSHYNPKPFTGHKGPQAADFAPYPRGSRAFCNSGGKSNNALYQRCKKSLGFKVSVFLLLLFCHIVASYWNQIVAKRKIKNGEEILVAYGSKYAP